MLVYLAGKTGRYLGKTDRARYETLHWLMFQMGGVGPMLGQTHHFRNYAQEKLEYAINRYTNETRRLYSVMDSQLGKTPYIAGRSYTIADMAIWPWLRNWQGQGQNLDDHPNLKRWFEQIGNRPAVQRAVKVLADLRKPVMDEKAREILFGATQYTRR
jgi:GST-like protein